MSYGFDTTVVDNESSSKFIQPGINKGIFLKEAKFVPKNGTTNAYMEITCETKDGRTVNRRYYEPSIDGNIVKDQAGLDKAVNKFAKVVANLTRKFLGDSYSVPQQPSFDAFCNKAIADLYTKQSLFATTELRTKVVLNTSGFPTLPGYAPIWENAALVSDADSKLKIDPAFDNVEVAKKNATPANAGGIGTPGVDQDNPF